MEGHEQNENKKGRSNEQIKIITGNISVMSSPSGFKIS
jgi:hypothetical protein